MSPSGPRPPRLLVLLARLLLRGDQGRLIQGDLEESFLRDLEKRIPPRRARRRYALNLLGSLWSVWTARLPRTLARGATLDAKLGLRMLTKQPMLTGVAMLALGLGIPSSLVLHHMLGVMLSPLPVPEGERVMGIRDYSLEISDPVTSSVHDFARWREAGLASFEEVAAARSYSVSVNAGDPGAPPVGGSEMSASAFGILRASPLMGRLLGPADEVRGAPDVVLLGEDLWRSRFAADPEIIGRVVKIGRVEHTVVGVMPGSFRFPMDDDVWLPLRASPLDYDEGEGPALWAFGRLRDGVTVERAALEVAQLTERLAVDDPERYARLVGEVVPMPLLFLEMDEIVRSDPEFLLLQSVMLALLLIVCGNVGTLILARTATRMGELSIRTALGASRTRIVTQLFIEALVLALVAAGLGLILAEATAQWLMMKLASSGVLPYWMDLGLSANTVLVALALAALAAVVAGVLPAFRATSRGVQANLQRTAAGKGSVRFGMGSSLLIVSEVVLSVGFLAMGGALVRSLLRDSTGLGLDPGRYLRVDLQVPWTDGALSSGASDEAAFRLRVAQTQQEVLRRLAEDEAVRGVGMGFGNLFPYDPATRDIILEGREDEGVAWDVATTRVDVGFFLDLGLPILAGRDFTEADPAPMQGAGPGPVIVNTTFVEQVLGGQNAVGQRFRLETPVQATEGRPAWYEIVGVVGRFGMNPMNPIEDAGFYEPLAAGASNPARYLVEVDGDPTAFAPRLRQIVAAVDPEATVDEAISLAEAWELDGALIRWLFLTELVLAGVAFVLAVSGLYALMSFTVSQRAREVAIRSALGARPWSIVSTIARKTAIQLGIGLALGGVWAWVLLSEIDRDDGSILSINKPVTILVTLAVTAIVGVVGCAAPTIRGVRIQPSEALREG